MYGSGLFGKSRATATSQSLAGIWSLQEHVEAKRSNKWPVVGDPFPGPYRTLINDFSSTIYYVDATNGSDSNTGTDVARFATVDKAVATASSGNMIVVYNGTYNNPNTYTSMYDAYYSSVLIDRSKNLTFVCAPGQVVFTGTDLGRRDYGAVTFGGSSSKIYGAIFKRNNGGRTNNYSVAFNRGGYGEFYNCAFQEIGTNGYFSLHYANGAITWSNCLIIGDTWRGNYNGTGSLLYSASNNASTAATGSNTGNGLGVTISSDWTVGSTAYGVYSGTYAWELPLFDYPS